MLIQVNEPLVVRCVKGECIIISKRGGISPGYEIRIAATELSDVEGKIMIEPDVDPVIIKKK